MTDQKDDKPNNTNPPHHVQVREDRMKLEQGSLADAKDKAQQEAERVTKGK